MSPQHNCDMNDAAAIRAVYPRHTMKRLARVMGVPLDTARHWLFRKMSLSKERRHELALTLLAEFDRQDREERAVIRRQLVAMSGGMDAEMVGGMDFGGDCCCDGAMAFAPIATGGATAGAIRQGVKRS